MKLEDKMLNALNDQINKEIFSAYLYYSMAAYFDSMNLEGFANWMKVQAKEELTHAQKLYDYIYDKGGVVELDSIDKPKKEWENPLEAFKDAYEHELSVTQSIDKLVDLAKELNDHATQNFLQWFVNEQVEEEANTKKIVDTLQMIGESKTALFMYNGQLGSRQ
ncbi:ferritin [Petrotoga miotherma DSM 10691]|jgi:ferritin|uniref:Ferritin n=2 Tax=Petrotoga TaxID=28236 RepID=A0A2K1PAL6_9BACT|nr:MULTISPECIES: ferritin [Petrotoga]MDK2906467.1 ferritin [Petrotoga sp.]PNR99831.1 ferritin [Petrotoga miotherma DSM 10691]POZ93591.1 ferritin [Petrotoga halophila DSM 16923]